MSEIDSLLRDKAIEAISVWERPSHASNPALKKLRSLGTELWLDTGEIEEARKVWRCEFQAMTTNNTLVNQVIQRGDVDESLKKLIRMIPGDKMTEQERVMELGFAANCVVGIRLIRAFDAHVSVELHPSVAEDIDRTVYYAERYYAICPERFIIKIPLTPEGCCAVHRVRVKGIPVNYTLGFSARQNYMTALLANPSYCNVFLGRLNVVVSENRFGDGHNVGEKASLATQRAILSIRERGLSQTRLIAASMRETSQITQLAGMDVFTIPPKVVADFMAEDQDIDSIHSHVTEKLAVNIQPEDMRPYFDTLWCVKENVHKMALHLGSLDKLHLTGEDIRQADSDFQTHLFHRFTPEEKLEIREHGKIPDMKRWISDSTISLDDLMTQSALQSFTKDQMELDNHLAKLMHA